MTKNLSFLRMMFSCTLRGRWSQTASGPKGLFRRKVASRSSADNLDGVLVGADGAVGAQAVELRTHGLGVFRGKFRIDRQAGVRHVVIDAHGEVIFGFRER